MTRTWEQLDALFGTKVARQDPLIDRDDEVWARVLDGFAYRLVVWRDGRVIEHRPEPLASAIRARTMAYDLERQLVIEREVHDDGVIVRRAMLNGPLHESREPPGPLDPRVIAGSRSAKPRRGRSSAARSPTACRCSTAATSAAAAGAASSSRTPATTPPAPPTATPAGATSTGACSTAAGAARATFSTPASRTRRASTRSTRSATTARSTRATSCRSTPLDPAAIEPFGFWLERHVHELVSEIERRLPFVN